MKMEPRRRRPASPEAWWPKREPMTKVRPTEAARVEMSTKGCEVGRPEGDQAELLRLTMLPEERKA